MTQPVRTTWRVLFRAAVLLLPLLVSATTLAAPQNFNRDYLALPSIVQDTTRPRECTVTYLVEDSATNDTFAVRMQISPAEKAVATAGRLPCPAQVPPHVSARALDGCRERAKNPKTCVFADMGRGFESDPQINNTSENASRCASDRASQIGIACWKSGKLDVCNVACGVTAGDAITAARTRCEAKQETSCNITGAVSVLAP
jgi:hypothetical protein